ncbi:SDR family NAD(P)-dependent oxidoreductase [Mycobacterium montefiorense]|uniref:Short-chain dehydrogenase n=1 Tax=Mycobacterium montefiorense TaxID=154654 RepID=A0AA37PNW2_9MYCO|nr:SDR family oxidoreductase [Mycobacterium montefiorense]GBG37801.1 short-chain dehydrogenase [Mycobacterium montefiorense]GKU34939.1 short-chain dehydrogenase [Mycobacterium montefiorense]GKU40952.1 short-chain dehydrogenase [Mycobacterium montefiorense]GKU47061.1 short-chain dehydrogenase [Mycobacterium montefiorense]GKU49181.1 short-chain dehydrogenase [Mycobacterium montefiorense]
MKPPNQTHPGRVAGTTAIVTGASRGFGRAIATALAEAGAEVVGVARSAALLDEVRGELGDVFIPVVADVADAATASQLIDKYAPRTLVLCAGSTPRMSPLPEQSWATFSANWNVDVAQAFHWTRHALARPLPPGSSVILMSSGAAVNGSPLSGGYAGAKATVRFIGSYAAGESDRAGLGITFVSLLPRLTAATELGAQAAAAYAKRQGVDVDTFVEQNGPALTVEQVGTSVSAIAGGEPGQHGAYLLTASGLSALN